MNKAFDQATVRLTLQRGLTAGHWSLDDLDQPSQGWTYTQQQAQRIHGFTHPPHRNLLRDDIPAEAVQPINPRDFDVAAATRPNKGQPNLDLHPHRWPDQPLVPDLGDGDHLSRHQDTPAAGTDHGQTPYLGSSWQHHTPGAGALRQPSLEPGEYLDDPAESDF
jgi:hypothetical protein